MVDTIYVDPPPITSARNAFTITPTDGVNLSRTVRAILSDMAGTVTVDMEGVGTNIALPLQAGYNPVTVTKVYATGTDNQLVLVGLW